MTDASVIEDVAGAGSVSRRSNASWPLLVWICLVIAAVAWGAAGGDGARGSGAAPFVGSWRLRLGWRSLPSMALTVAAVVAVPSLVNRLGWRRLLLGTAVLAASWASALSFVDGPGALTDPLRSRYDYLRYVPRVGSPGEYLRDYVDELPREANHVKTHPPGVVLLFWAMDRIGLKGEGPVAALVLCATAATPVAVALALRDVVGEREARAAAPFLALGPSAVWMAVSEDALFAAVTAAGITGVVLATSRRGWRSHAWALGGGMVLGAAAFLSYGMVALFGVPLVVAWFRRRAVPVAIAALGLVAVAVVFAAAGFWWPAGLAASIERVETGISSSRPYGYYLLANVAAFAVALGPAVVVALSRLRSRAAWLLCGAALAPLVPIALSGVWRGETERLWLPFVAWATAATIALADRRHGVSRYWLGVHAGAGVVVQSALFSPW